MYSRNHAAIRSGAVAVTETGAGRDGRRGGGLRRPARPRWLSGVAGGPGPGDADGDRAGGLVHPPGRAHRPGRDSPGGRDRRHGSGRRGGRRAPGQGGPGHGRGAGGRGAGHRLVPADLGGRRAGPGDAGLVAAAGHPGGTGPAVVRAVPADGGGVCDQPPARAAGIGHPSQLRAAPTGMWPSAPPTGCGCRPGTSRHATAPPCCCCPAPGPPAPRCSARPRCWPGTATGRCCSTAAATAAPAGTRWTSAGGAAGTSPPPCRSWPASPASTPGKIAVLGESMGGEQALAAMGADPRIRAVVAEGATGHAARRPRLAAARHRRGPAARHGMGAVHRGRAAQRRPTPDEPSPMPSGPPPPGRC